MTINYEKLNNIAIYHQIMEHKRWAETLQRIYQCYGDKCTLNDIILSLEQQKQKYELLIAGK